MRVRAPPRPLPSRLPALICVRAGGYFPGMPTNATPSSSPPLPSRPLPVWLPWLAAPAFALLPIGGCGLATRLHRPAAAQAGVAAVRPMADAVPLVPVVRIAPLDAGHRQVAWGRPTN